MLSIVKDCIIGSFYVYVQFAFGIISGRNNSEVLVLDHIRDRLKVVVALL